MIEPRKTNPLKLREELKRINDLSNICRTENINSDLSSMLNDIDSSLSDVISDFEHDYYQIVSLSIQVLDFLRSNKSKKYSPHRISEELTGEKKTKKVKFVANGIARVLKDMERSGYVKKTRDNANNIAEFYASQKNVEYVKWENQKPE